MNSHYLHEKIFLYALNETLLTRTLIRGP